MKRPMALAALALMAGILLIYLKLPVVILAGILVFFTGLALLWGKQRPSVVLVLAVLYLAGAFVMTTDTEKMHALDAWQDAEVVLEGRVATVPEVSDGRTSFILELERIEDTPMAARVRITTAAEAPLYGAHLSAEGTLRTFEGKRNPGGFNAFLYYQGIDVAATLWTETYTQTPADVNFLYLPGQLNQYFSDQCDRVFASEQASLIKGLVLGNRSMDSAEEALFQDAGIAHILSVSGLHTAYICGAVLALLKLVKAKRAHQLGVLVVVLVFYMALTGFVPSVVRAGIMLLALTAGRCFALEYDALSGLSLAAVVMLLLEPAQLFAASFQLSFGAMLGILFFHAPLRHQVKRLGLRRGQWLVDNVLLTFCATVGTLPMTLYHFQTFNPVGLAANIMLVPLSGLLLLVSMFTLPLLALLPAAAGLCALPAAFLADATLALTRFFAGFDFLIGHRGALTIAETLLCLTALFLLAGYFDLKNKRVQQGLKAAGVSLLMCIGFTALKPKPFTITFLDVGQGDSALIETPSGGAYLIDGGGYEMFEEADPVKRQPISEAVLLPALYSKNITALSGVFISHNHADHAQGIEEILAEMPVAHLYVSTQYNNAYYLEQTQVPVSQLGAGDVLTTEDGLTVEVLWPGSEIAKAADDAQNEASMVLKITYGNHRFLFMGDAGFETETALADEQLESDVLKTGHHGSRYATSEGFLGAVSPAAAVISVGENNLYGHPTEEVLNRLDSAGAVVYRTDRHGAVVFTSNGKNLQVQTYLKGAT